MKQLNRQSAINLAVVIGVLVVAVCAAVFWPQIKILHQPPIEPSSYVSAAELLPQPFDEVHTQPSLERLRVILMYPEHTNSVGHVDRQQELQAVGSTDPLPPGATCTILPSDSLVEIGRLDDGLVVAVFHSSRPRADTGCASGDVVIGRAVWFDQKRVSTA